MNRFLTYTAVALFMGLAPALAEDPAGDPSQSPPAAQDQHMQTAPADPASPSQALPVEPSEPATPIPDDSGKSSQMMPDASQPDAAPPAQSSQAVPDPAAPPAQSSQAAPEPAAPPADSQAQSEAPKSVAPPADIAASTPKFLDRQAASDWLASSLIGKSVVNAANESLGSISDLVTGEDGKVNAVLIQSGGFLGIGSKDIAVPFTDLKLSRDENDNITVAINLSKDTIASAPDYETLAEQKVTVGSNKADRGDLGQ